MIRRKVKWKIEEYSIFGVEFKEKKDYADYLIEKLAKVFCQNKRLKRYAKDLTSKFK